MGQVRAGDVVHIRYSGVSSNGTAFGTSESSEPLRFNVDSEQVIEGLRLAVLGMRSGEVKTVTVPPEQGFGPRLPECVYRIGRGTLPENVRVGDRLSGLSGDQVVPVWVAALDGESATMDANHPLAGQTLVLQIELVGIQPQGKPTVTAHQGQGQTRTGSQPSSGPSNRGRNPRVFHRRR